MAQRRPADQLAREPTGHDGSDDTSEGDGSLVARARRGDRAAFSELLERHRKLALALAREVVGDPQVAADVVQEAAVTALVGLTRLRDPSKFGPWFAGIALNLARRWWRDARRDHTRFTTDAPTLDDPEELAVRADLAARVRDAVDRLPTGQREAVHAFYWKGLTHAETAAELGVTTGAVKARLHQARATLAPTLALHATAGVQTDRTTYRGGRTQKETRTMSVEAHTTTTEWIAVEVEAVRRSRSDATGLDFHAVELREPTGDRRVPIYVGAAEATALAFNIETVETPRPMTYAMASQLVKAGGARVLDVRITRLTDGVVYAVVRVDGPAGPGEVDARPSDALNLALVSEVPVLVAAHVFEELRSCSLSDWERYPSGTRDLVSEAQARQSRLMAATASLRRQGEADAV